MIKQGRKIEHGMSYTSFYSRYAQAKRRCCNPNNKDYGNYGGRGIKFMWKSFNEFYIDMYPSFKDGLTIERIDVNGNYCKENCRWATLKEQGQNKRNSRFITFKKETKTISAWAEFLGINRYIIENRLNRGWNVQKALSSKVRIYGN